MSAARIGRYEIDRELGRGGMAVVYLARDTIMKRQVALKVLPRQFTFDPQFRARFQREAEAIAALEHPAIVTVFDVGEHDDQPYLVMRYMSGGSLQNRLAAGTVTPAMLDAILQRVGGALDEAHAQGIIHRDLKPGNILFDARGEAYLSDFGIAKVAEATAAFTGAGIIGTPEYMSPEQARAAKDLDGRSDVYSLGVVIFEVLAGQLPFKADTPIGMALAHVTEAVPSLPEVKPDLPAGLNAVVQRALAKNPAERYASAGALALAFNQASQSRPPAAPVQVGPATVFEAPPPPEPPSTSVDWPQTVMEPPPAATAGHGLTALPAPGPVRSGKRAAPWLAAGGGLLAFFVCLLAGAGLLAVMRPKGTGAALLGRATESPPPGSTATREIHLTATRQAHLTGTAGAERTAAHAAVQATTGASRRTATARAHATNDVRRESTAAAQQKTEVARGELLDRLQNADWMFGPAEGSLPHDPANGLVEGLQAEVNLDNFVVELTFFNPYAASVGSWSHGLIFRRASAGNELRLIINSDKTWSLYNWTNGQSVRLDEGRISKLNTTANGSNEVGLICRNSVGLLYINGDNVADLNLSSRTHAGGIWIATGMFEGDEVSGYSTRYQGFTIWSIR